MISIYAFGRPRSQHYFISSLIYAVLKRMDHPFNAQYEGLANPSHSGYLIDSQHRYTKFSVSVCPAASNASNLFLWL